MKDSLRMIGVVVALLVLGSPAWAQGEPSATILTIESQPEMRTGEPHEVTVVLTDVHGAPLAGQYVTVLERLRIFDYADRVPAARVRTDHRGAATVSHVPTVPGVGQLTAEFAGDEAYAPATATTTIGVEPGTDMMAVPLTSRPDTILPRGVTAAWFLPLLVGVWLAISFAVYQVAGLPRERERSQPEPS
jgi:hypothetical protein